MCGLLSIHFNDSLALTAEKAQRALDALYHRGPDAFGIWQSAYKDHLLGHRRLSIVGLDTANNRSPTKPKTST